MIRYKRKLMELSDSGNEISVAIIGTGFMGSALSSQLIGMNGIKPRILVNRTVSKAKDVLINSGINEQDICNKTFDKKKYLITDDIDIAIAEPKIDVIVDATGVPETGANIAKKAVENGKDVVSFNVETDSTVGVILSDMAKKNNLIYTGIYGDEPGAIKELYDFAEILGFEVLTVGKGKNNPLDYSANPESLFEEAVAKKLNVDKLVSFVDGTNTMIELCTTGNAIGFMPDVPGCHGITASVGELPDILKLKSEGGILNSYKALEYVFGIAPGVFITIRTDNPIIDYQMKFLKMGTGDSYVLYRPYHLTGIEAPLSIFKAYFDREVSIAPISQVNDVSVKAKKDMVKGEHFDDIGGYSTYGVIERNDLAVHEGHVPIGLINRNCYAKTDIKKGEYLTEENTSLDVNSCIYKLRKLQDKTV